MSRVKEGRSKRMPWCVSCLIACLVIVVVFVVGIIIAANVTFNKFVSPMIGGIKLGECTKLLTGALNSNRDKIVTNEYTADDLDDFYFTLNSMLYQKELTDEEYQARYDALSEEEKAEYPTVEAYKEAHPYRIDIDSLTSSLKLDELIGGNQETPTDGEVSAAGEDENNSSSGGSNVDNTDNEQLQELFKQLAFDFGVLKKYPYTNTEEDLSYTTFQITGNQMAAVVNEIASVVMKSVNLGNTMPELEGVDFSKYASVPQITASDVQYEDSNGNTLTKPMLSIVVELKTRKLIEEAFVPMLEKQGVPKFALNVIKILLPKNFFVSLETYPTDKDSEVSIKINNMNDKACESLKTIVNSLAEKFNFTLFPKDGEGQPDQDASTDQTQEKTTIFNEINTMVVNVFTKINEFVPVQFVSNEQGSVSLRVAHIQGLLKVMGLFDENDLENSVTPHMFLTTLRCLFDEATPENNKAELANLYAQLDAKYGIDQSYWNDKSLLDAEALENITEAINITEVEFKTNEDMRVNLKDGELATLIDEAIKKGTFGSGNETPLSMAGEGGDNQLLDMVNFEAVNIKYIESVNQNNYSYIDESGVESEKINALIKKYTFEATVSVSIADLLTSQTGEGEEASGVQPIINSLKSALPEKLCLALVLHIDDVYNTQDGKLFNRVIAGVAGDTTFKINKFDENYSSKVLDMIQKLVNKFSSNGAGESQETENSTFDISSISTQISDALSTTLKQLKDSLYCDLLIEDKSLILPSVYELVYGMGKKQVETNENLTEDDLISISEIKDLFVQVYNTDFYIVENDGITPSNPENYDKILYRYNQDAGDTFLSILSSKYYMSSPITTDEILGEKGLTISTNRLNFKGENGLYYDQTATDSLDVFVSGDALASLIANSGKLNSLTESTNNNFISNLSIITAEFDWQDSELYLNFDFEANINPSVSSETEGINISAFIPNNAFITAKIAMKTDDEANLYSTDLLLNNSSITNLVKLLNLFSNEKIDNSTITNEIKTSISDVFDTINENVNLKYNNANEQEALAFKNIFNTINKLSHKNDLEYVSSDEDDEKLRSLLKEFGRAPKFTTNEENVINNVTDVRYFSNSVDDIYKISDSDSFFEELNKNFYISDDNLITVDSLSTLTTVDSDFIDFNKLYTDVRTIDEIETKLTSNRFTSLANKLMGTVNLEDGIGEAKIIQSRIKNDGVTKSLDAVAYVTFSSLDPSVVALLPSHVFITATVDLTSVDELGNKTYQTDLFINDFTSEETNDLFNRISLLESSLSLNFNISLDTLKTTIRDEIKGIFDGDMTMFGEPVIENGFIDIPNIFDYITGGTIEGSVYNQNKPLFEKSKLSLSGDNYGINEDGKAGYYDNGNFIVLGDAQKVNNLWGYYDGENFVTIQTTPEQLMHNLRVFGNKPTEETIKITSTDTLGYSILGYNNTVETKSYQAGKNITVYGNIGINLQNFEDGFYFYDQEKGYYFDTQAHFFDMVNTNYYITGEGKINANTVNSGTFVIGNDLFNFYELYNDKRSFEDTKIKVNGNTFAALAEEFYEGGIKLSETNSAKIIQMHLYTKDKTENSDHLIDNYSTLKTIVRVSLTDSTDKSNVLPEYLYMVCYTIIDPDAGTRRFDSEFIINNFGFDYVDVKDYSGIYGQIEETQNFIDRLNTLKESFGLTFTFELSDIKNTIKETFRSIFEDKLSTFGDIKYENDSFIIPNIFQYLTGGQLVGSSESLNYDTTIKMKEFDGITLTEPEVLRNRLQELGTGVKYTESITAWNGDIYNDNRFTESDLDNFFTDMQAYYFLNKKPTSDNLMGGSFFTDLTGESFETTFNLKGLTTSEIGIRGEYISKGLFNYTGAQQSLKLSDKALAGLINSQNAINIDSIGSVGSVKITSIKLEYISESAINIEITIKVTTQEQAGKVNAMPEVFYLTTKTTRNVVSGVPSYSTTIAVNAFNPEELDNLLANLNHIEENTSFGIKNNLDTESLKTSVENAIKELFDGKLKDYSTGFGSYENAENGIGYIQFPNIYSKIYETTGATKGNEVDLQNVIVKLNNKNKTLETNKYDPSSDNISISYPLPKYLTDRQFAYLLNGIFKVDASYSYIAVEQVVIFKGESDKYAEFEKLIQNVNPSFTFDPLTGGYYFITVSIDTSNLSCNMAIAPEKIYLTLVVDNEGNLVKYTNDDGVLTSTKFAQDFTTNELDLFLSIFTDNNNKLDFDQKLEDNIKSVMTYVTDKSLHQNANLNEADFNGYYGYVGTME